MDVSTLFYICRYCVFTCVMFLDMLKDSGRLKVYFVGLLCLSGAVKTNKNTHYMQVALYGFAYRLGLIQRVKFSTELSKYFKVFF